LKAHIVPRTYLKRFGKNGKIVVIPRPDDSNDVDALVAAQALTSVKKAATRENYYDLKDASGEDVNFEEALSKFEARIPEVLKRLRTDGDLDKKDRAFVATFAALQEARSELIVSRHKQFLEIQFDKVRETAKELARDPDDLLREYIKETVTNGNVLPTPQNLALLAIGYGFTANMDIYPSMNQCLIRSSGRRFITSRHPVVWVDPRTPKGPHPIRASLSAEVTFPLTQRHCLLMTYWPILSSVDADDDAIRLINARTASRSAHVFAPPMPDKSEQSALVGDLKTSAVEDFLGLRYEDKGTSLVDPRPLLFKSGVFTVEEVDAMFREANNSKEGTQEVESLKRVLADIDDVNRSLPNAWAATE
jgi:hypothetical protein